MANWAVLRFWIHVYIMSCLTYWVLGKKPHIVMVVADDYGFRDIGYHGAEFSTPNLDKLAGMGIKLENYYVQPICSPTRSQLMTGRYQIHTGLQHNIIWPSQPYGLPLEFPTLADFLRAQGYSTHAVGKWHLGLHQIAYTPLHRGFDSFYGYWTGGEDYYQYNLCDRFHNRSIDLPNSDILTPHGSNDTSGPQVQWCGYDLRDNETPVRNMNGTYSTHLYTKKAIDAVQKTAASDKPLFLYLAYQAVHSPLEAPQEYITPFSYIKNKARRTYAGMTSAMDEGVGNLTQALIAAGMWEDTILIFTTDNGGQVLAGGNNWPLRGYKHTLWEGGVRGVGFVSGPRLNHSGVVSEGLMHVSDWFPTIASMVGSKVNASLKLDGEDQWAMLSQGSPSPRNQILHNIDPLYPPRGERMNKSSFDTRIRAALRVGDYKIITGDPGDDRWFPPPQMTEQLGGSALEKSSNAAQNVWLYNIRDDPSEVLNLSFMMEEKVLEMLDILAEYNTTAVPAVYPKSDANCDPRLGNGYWGPWSDK